MPSGLDIITQMNNSQFPPQTKIKSIIVTGASRGIGAACVRALRTRAVKVVGIARSGGELRRLAQEKIGPGLFVPIEGDVCDAAVLRRALEAASQADLQGLILNAAYRPTSHY
jgi:NAD(P)-dependent dehydrogenase (short-subunit alcohol dehydrogenase family)